MKYLKYFETEALYASYKNGSDYVLPNVSYIEEIKGVSYEPYEVQETRVVCTYNVTNTTSAYPVCGNASNFASMEVDGVLLDSVATHHTFDVVGEHTVKFELADPTSIGEYSFASCSNLTSIVIPDSVTSIGYKAFYDCRRLTGELVIPNSVTSIGRVAFQNCTLTGELVIPNSVTSIGEGAFQTCRGLISIVISDSVTSIGEGAFARCDGVHTVHIGSGVTSIGGYAFNGCSRLTSITCLAPTAPSINSNTFWGVKENGVLKVPADSDYSSWMSTGDYYLGKYNWTIEYI